MCSMKGSSLFDPLIDGSQSHIPSYLLTPSLTDHAQTLPQPTTKEHILIEIEPKPAIFLQNTKPTDHIVMRVLALKHWDSQALDVTPSRLQASFVMSIPYKLIGILASTVATRPVDLPFLAADLAI